MMPALRRPLPRASGLPAFCGDVSVGWQGRAPHDKQLTDVLHRRSLEFGTDAREQPFALVAVGVEDTHLDQFVREQIHVDLMQHRSGQTLATDADDGIQALRSGTQFATLRGCQSTHGESLTHCRQRLRKSGMSQRGELFILHESSEQFTLASRCRTESQPNLP